MASLEVYNAPLCEEGGCSARVTRKIRTAAGTFHLYCSKHAGPALIAESKKEESKATKGGA